MDLNPNVTLRRMRQLASSTMSKDEADELQALFHSLDEWLFRGGALPDGWSRDPVERAVFNTVGGAWQEDDEEPGREPSAEQERAWDDQYDGTSLGR